MGLSKKRAKAGRKGGVATSAQTQYTSKHGVDRASGYMAQHLYDGVLEDDYTYQRPEQVAGGKVVDWTESDDDDDRVAANDRGRGNASYVQYGDVNPGHPNYRSSEHKMTVGELGELLADIEETVGGFRTGLGWRGTYRWSERAIVRRALRGIPEEVYPEEM